MPEQVAGTAIPTVVEYVVARLAALGIGHVFGVPGDYAFPFDDAIEHNADLEWVGAANELNAAYAADGYARVHGASILSTTYGVGELSALNGVMGAMAERSPVFHLVGQPSTKTQSLGRITHHTLGNGRYDQFRPLSAVSVCAAANLTPQNAVSETERVIAEVAARRCPGYLTVAQDLALMPILEAPVDGVRWADIPAPSSNAGELAAAVAEIVERIKAAGSTVLVPGMLLQRYGLTGELEKLLAAGGFGYVTTPIAKALISEDHPQYLGMYDGLLTAPDVAQTVQGADLVLELGGVVLEDLNTGGWTAHFDPAKTITVHDDRVVIGETVYTGITLGDVLAGLVETFTADGAPSGQAAPSSTAGPADSPAPGGGDDQLSSAALYPRFHQFLREGDILVSETGLSASPLQGMRLPKDASFLSQTLWGSIGWATPAAFGAAVAAPDRRVVLVTGDGSHQLTANELGAMGRQGVTPVIIVLNNSVFGIEEYLAPVQGNEYNELAPWNYADVPAAMGCADWQCVKVTTVAELEAALERAQAAESAVYIEVLLPRSDVPPPMPSPILERLYGLDKEGDGI